MKRTGFVIIVGLAMLIAPASSPGQASKRLEEASKRMESAQQKMKHADDIMRQQDRMSSKRTVVDKRKNPKARPTVKRMVLPRPQ